MRRAVVVYCGTTHHVIEYVALEILSKLGKHGVFPSSPLIHYFLDTIFRNTVSPHEAQWYKVCSHRITNYLFFVTSTNSVTTIVEPTAIKNHILPVLVRGHCPCGPC